MTPKTATRAQSVESLVENIAGVFIGKPETVLWTVATLVARGHLLIEDVPGIGKTLLGQALAKSIDASFRRIQFTSDMLPSDILGLSIFDQATKSFEFKPGPIFSHIVLIDEINRAAPKTQSALLEAMNELQVTLDGKTHALSEPFMVIATQNPVEYHGTFPLPEAQLDRFFMRVRIGYPSTDNEIKILQEPDHERRLKELKPILSLADVQQLQGQCEAVRIDESLLRYTVAIAQATREAKSVKLGLSPRGALSLSRAAQAHALVNGRDYAIPDDFKRVAPRVLSHRLIFDSHLYGIARIAESEALVEDILRSVPSP